MASAHNVVNGSWQAVAAYPEKSLPGSELANHQKIAKVVASRQIALIPKVQFMKTKLVVLCATALLIASPAMAKKQRPQGGKPSGVYCVSGADSAYFPIAMFKPSVRNKLHKGQKIKINIAGYGPANCSVY